MRQQLADELPVVLVGQDPVVLFMKGEPSAPRCGFSAKAVGILDALSPGYASVDVLADPEIREGIKAYGDWPTIPAQHWPETSA